MPVNQGCERSFGIFVAALEEPLEQLAVGQAAGRAGAKQGLDLLEEFHWRPDGNVFRVPVRLEGPIAYRGLRNVRLKA